MIKSMTGFASLTREDDAARIGLTLRAVNHRFLDLQLRAAANLADLEPRVRALLQKRLARGRVELSVSLQLRQGPRRRSNCRRSSPARWRRPSTSRASAGWSKASSRPAICCACRRRSSFASGRADGESLGEAFGAAMERALGRGDRSARGRCARARATHLAADLTARKDALGGLIESLAAAADDGRQDLEARLAQRVKELLALVPGDPAAIAQEIVRVAQRSDITEEVTRFRGHLAHWEALTAAPEPCGRKLDFLLQEMNREINTIGSKADGLQVSELDHPGEGRARADARAGAECRVSVPAVSTAAAASAVARAALHRLGAVGDRQDDAGRAAGSDSAQPAHVAVLHLARGARRASATASTIISSAARHSSSGSTRGAVPRVGGCLRQLLRHGRRGRRADAARRDRTWCWSSTCRARVR